MTATTKTWKRPVGWQRERGAKTMNREGVHGCRSSNVRPTLPMDGRDGHCWKDTLPRRVPRSSEEGLCQKGYPRRSSRVLPVAALPRTRDARPRARVHARPHGSGSLATASARRRTLPEVQAQFNTPQFETQTTTKTGDRLKRPPRMAQVHALGWWAPPGFRQVPLESRPYNVRK
jgi:hypothetical protein